MKIGIVYSSPNGTTEKVARFLADCLSGQDRDVLLFDLGEIFKTKERFKIPEKWKEVDILGIGSPIYHMRLIRPVNVFLNELAQGQMQVEKAFYFGTYGGITSGNVLIETGNLLQSQGIKTCGAAKFYAPHFWDRKGYPYESIRDQISQFASAMIDKNFKSIPMDQMQKRIGRMKLMARLLHPVIPEISRKRELLIRINRELCVQCGKCEKQCPMGAISRIDGIVGINNAECIHCYHCTTLCPKGAVICETGKLQRFIRMNKIIIGVEDPATRFWV